MCHSVVITALLSWLDVSAVAESPEIRLVLRPPDGVTDPGHVGAEPVHTERGRPPAARTSPLQLPPSDLGIERSLVTSS